MIDDIDINKIVVSNKFTYGKQDFKYFIGYKDDTKLDLWAYYFQKLVYKKDILIKLNVFIFFFY